MVSAVVVVVVVVVVVFFVVVVVVVAVIFIAAEAPLVAMLVKIICLLNELNVKDKFTISVNLQSKEVFGITL